MCGTSTYDSTYYSPSQSWSSAPGAYSSSYASGYSYPSQSAPTSQYTQPAPQPVVFYPSVYSTISQQQIHVHVHAGGTGDLGDPAEEVPLTALAPLRSAADVLQAITANTDTPQDDRKFEEVQGTDTSVWRPYYNV